MGDKPIRQEPKKKKKRGSKRGSGCKQRRNWKYGILGNLGKRRKWTVFIGQGDWQ